MSDDGFHEIQLNGKQLIFLSMTAALVLVVAFLSGVLVGRGVRSQKDATVAGDVLAAAPLGDPVPQSDPSAPQAAAAPPINAIAPPTPADEDLSYNSRLEDKQPPRESLATSESQPGRDPSPKAQTPAAKDTAKPASPAVPVQSVPAPPMPKPADPAKAKVDASLAAEPAGSGYYLKIGAYRGRPQADSMARRLGGKGYTTYIVPLSGRGPVLYSVRVGKYKTRREADSIRRRLEKEERLKPLISR
jgi:cell division protein FtsN